MRRKLFEASSDVLYATFQFICYALFEGFPSQKLMLSENRIYLLCDGMYTLLYAHLYRSFFLFELVRAHTSIIHLRIVLFRLRRMLI